jgi:hypothetical protein
VCVAGVRFAARGAVIPGAWPRWNSRYSRSRIDYISSSVIHRHPASESRTRGLPAIGFQLEVPPGVALEQIDPAGPERAVVLRARETAAGRLVGELEMGLFSAALIVDRAGVLQELVESAAAVALGPGHTARLLAAGEASFAAGASGFRIDVVLGAPRPPAPYQSWLALASDDLALRGGLFVTMRAAGPTWPAASHMLDSLRISGPGGARAPLAGRLALPLLRGR